MNQVINQPKKQNELIHPLFTLTEDTIRSTCHILYIRTWHVKIGGIIK